MLRKKAAELKTEKGCNMKKAVKIILIVLVCAWAVIVTVGSIRMNEEMLNEQAKLQEKYNELKTEYDALKTDKDDGGGITLSRGLAYELLFDSVFYGQIMKEEYDMATEIDKRVEQYGLDDTGETELLLYLQVLIDKYEIAMEDLQ